MPISSCKKGELTPADNNIRKWIIDLFHKSHNAPVPYPTMHHFVTDVHICAHFCYKMVHCGVFDWCIVRFVTLVYFYITKEEKLLGGDEESIQGV